MENPLFLPLHRLGFRRIRLPAVCLFEIAQDCLVIHITKHPMRFLRSDVHAARQQ